MSKHSRSRGQRLLALAFVLPTAFAVSSWNPYQPKHWFDHYKDLEISAGTRELGRAVKESARCMGENAHKLEYTSPGEKMNGAEFFNKCAPTVWQTYRAFRFLDIFTGPPPPN